MDMSFLDDVNKRTPFVFPDLTERDKDAKYLLCRGFMKLDWKSYAKRLRLRAEKNVFSEMFFDIGDVKVYTDIDTGLLTAEFWPDGCIINGLSPTISKGHLTPAQALSGITDAVIETFKKLVGEKSLADWDCSIV